MTMKIPLPKDITQFMKEDTNPGTFLMTLERYIKDDELVGELWHLESSAMAELTRFLDEVHKLVVSFFLNHCQLTCLQLIVIKLSKKPQIRCKIIWFLGSIYGSRVELPPSFMIQGVAEVTNQGLLASGGSHIVQQGTWGLKKVQIKSIDLNDYNAEQEEV